MKVELFSVFDSKVNAFMEPWHARTIEEAIRTFRFQVNRSEGNLHLFPEDYSLFHVGSFVPESGQVIPNATPVNLGLALTFVEVPNGA